MHYNFFLHGHHIEGYFSYGIYMNLLIVSVVLQTLQILSTYLLQTHCILPPVKSRQRLLPECGKSMEARWGKCACVCVCNFLAVSENKKKTWQV